MASKRFYWIDNAKCLLIFLVVLGHFNYWVAGNGHILDRSKFVIYLFHMPAFIFLSGMTSFKNVQEKRWARTGSFLILFLFMELLHYVCENLIFELDKPMDLLQEDRSPWYAMALCWWTLLTILVRKIRPVYVLTASVLLSLFCGYDTVLSPFLVIRRTLVFYPFFYLGYLATVRHKQEVSFPTGVRIGAAVLLALLAAVFFIQYPRISFWEDLFRGSFDYYQIGEGLDVRWGWAWRLAAYGVSACLSFLFFIVIPRKKIPLMTLIGQRSLSVYALHLAVIILLMNGLRSCRDWVENGHIVVLFPLAAILVIVLSWKPFHLLVDKIISIPSAIAKHE